MLTIAAIAELRRQLADWRRAGASIALVPTMGNLHRGHLSLVEEARRQAGRVVVSIFVNPTQFAPGEDYASYPRTPQRDAELLREAGADLLFLPGAAEVYRAGSLPATYVEVPGLSDELCGAFRPGHFRGVTTVVCKLFNMVQPDVALFGDKDYQQLTLIRRMVADLDLPVRIVGMPTVREASGLALSSRNGYLGSAEQQQAARLYAVLQDTSAQLRAGGRNYQDLEGQACAALTSAGFRPDYVAIRSADLSAPSGDARQLVILAAVRLGKARLIDNLQVSL
jgi:pantoate--beta-alanine ligase